jgi:hypothetical protein
MVAKIHIADGFLSLYFLLPKITNREAFSVGHLFWNAEGPMKKFIFAVLVLMLGSTVSAHANNSGTCCVTNISGFSQSGPLGPTPAMPLLHNPHHATNVPGI